MTTKIQAGQLQRQVYVANRIKTANESIYYVADDIHRAIRNNRQISFQYPEWNLNRKLVPKRDGKREGAALVERFDIADYANKTFGMYGGREETLACYGESFEKDVP